MIEEMSKLTENGTLTSEKTKAYLRAQKREELPYINDLYDTINGKKVLIPRRQPSNKGSMINYKSSVADIQKWLKEKQFSPRVLVLFSKFNGSDMFLLSRQELEKHCGEEGKRLYSLLLVQKKRSNYNSFSKSDPALQAILKMRRIEVEKQNEADAEPEEDPPVATNNSVVINSSEEEKSDTITPLVPFSKRNQVIVPKKRNEVAPQAAPRKIPTYQPTRLASPPEAPVRRESWIQTIKSYK